MIQNGQMLNISYCNIERIQFSLMQCQENDLEQKQMENISYASIVGSLMYAQTCTKPNINFAVGMFGRYQSNPFFNQ